VLVRGKRLSSDFLAGMETGEIVTYLERELKQLTLDTMEAPTGAREEKPD
jgi:hypothetical protein